MSTAVSTPDEVCGKAMNLQLAGQLDAAEKLYRSVLDDDPEHAIANHCLGMLNVQLGRPAQGLQFLLTALTARPEISDYWLGYLEALLQAGQPDAAHDTLALARQHGLSGKAVDEFAARLPHRAAPPTDDAALLALIAEHRFAEALQQTRLMTERFPEHGLGWKIRGALLWGEGRTDDALAAMQTAARLQPGDPETLSNLGMSLASLKRYDEAESYLRNSLALNPDFAAAHYRLGMTYELQGRYDEAEARLRKATALRSAPLSTDDEQGFSNLLYVLSHKSGLDADSLFAEHRQVGQYFEADGRAHRPSPGVAGDEDRPLRLGFVSADLRDHSVATFFEPVIARLARSGRLVLHAYYNHRAEDGVTARLRGYFDHWHAIAALTNGDLAARIANDGIDILIDLSGHTALNRLRTFARKPAPIQVSWLGYPGTTGLQGMDYYLADSCWLAPGRFDRLFTEKLVYLPDRWAFQTHHEAPAVGPLPGLANGRLTFGSFHRLGKINSASIELWSQLLLAMPSSTLLLVGIAADKRANILKQFAIQNVAGERLVLVERCPMKRYLELHQSIDICLDTQPYAGATTSMHSLSMGVPTLTVAGATAQAQACAGILRHVALESFIAVDAADFVRKGRYWAEHLPQLAEVRAGLRARLSRSPAGQPELIAGHLEGALRHMWRRWCAHLPPESFATDSVAT